MIRVTKSLGTILLAIWLIVSALLEIAGLSFPAAGLILAILAIAAGVVLLLGVRSGRRYTNLGMILLAIWLIATGLLSMLHVSFAGAGTVLAILAIAAGLLLLFGVRGRSRLGSVGMLLLAIWLILIGLMALLGLSFAGSGIILAVIALAAGILLLLGR